MEDNYKQRGFYSELLAPEASKEIKQIAQTMKPGPDESSIIRISTKQTVPRAYIPQRGSKGSFRGRSKMLDSSRGSISSRGSKLGLNTKNTSMTRSRFAFGESKQPTSTLGFYSKQEDGVADAEPKVMESYEPIQGRVPRKVELDRKKKEFKSFDLEKLLEERGIFKREEEAHLTWLPLDLFDDETYDDYSPEEWILKAGSGTEPGQLLALRGQGLSEVDGDRAWRPVLIDSYDPAIKQFKGSFIDAGREPASLKRIDLCFDIEDPRKFADRVKVAHEARRLTDSNVRYKFYIDNMPRQDVNTMDTEQKTRLIDKAKKTKMLSKPGNPNVGTIEELKSEACQEYEKTMNKIIFDEYVEEANPDLIPIKLQLAAPEAPPVPQYGLVDIPKADEEVSGELFVYPASNDFSEIFREFCFSSLFIKEEVIEALQSIKEKCKEVSESDLFNIKYAGGERIDAFRNAQDGEISRLSSHLKDVWIQDMTKIIREKFADVGKGWFNMKETNRLTYEFGKLKRFLTVVRLNMQDSLYTLVKNGLLNFKAYLLSFIPQKVEIVDETKVKNYYGEVDARFRHNLGKPLMKIDLVKLPQAFEFGYPIKPKKIVEEVLKLFEKALDELESIPDLEPLILESLHKAKKNDTYVVTPILLKQAPIPPDENAPTKTYPDENKWVWDLHQEFREIMEGAVRPLTEFTSQFDKFKDLLKGDADEYINTLEANEDFKEAASIKAEIQKYTQMRTDLVKKIPEEIQVSCFLVECKELISILSGKFDELIKRLKGLLVRRARNAISEVHLTMRSFDKRIRENPDNIEDLTKTRDFIEHELPEKLLKLKQLTESAVEMYDILEEYDHPVDNQDKRKRWEVFGGPLELDELIELRGKEFESKNEEFLEFQIEDQEEFEKKIKKREIAINLLHEYNALGNHEEYDRQLRTIEEQLTEMEEEARLYNNREELFGQEVTEYFKIEDLQKQLKPYLNLWSNINVWMLNASKWMKNSWEKVDADGADRFVDAGLKTISECINTFEGLEDPAHSQLVEVAKQVRKEVIEFKPKVPLLVCLKRQGMAQRHWTEISGILGEEITPFRRDKKDPKSPRAAKEKKQKFNFEYVCQQGLLEYVKECMSIGEKAYMEYDIEQKLNKMEEDWKDLEFSLVKHSNNSAVIESFEDAEKVLDEHMNETQNLLINPYKEFYQQRIDIWYEKLLRVSQTIEDWATLQKTWAYLSPIFESDDIARELPVETTHFKRVNNSWKTVMDQTKLNKNVLKICEDAELGNKFRDCNALLDEIQRKLNDYIEKKRNAFGRFYFLSDDDLLKILSQTKDVERIQDHLTKVFENIAELDFDKHKKIIAMNSNEKEKIKFVRPVDPKDYGGKVEQWMAKVEDMMVQSVRAELLESVRRYPNMPRNEWILANKGQCVLNGSQIMWTNEVESMIYRRAEGDEKAYVDYFKALETQLKGLINIERGNLTKNQRTTVEALIVIDVHALDIVEKKLQQVYSLQAFDWNSQLRYYEREDPELAAKAAEQDQAAEAAVQHMDCYVECVQTVFKYGYEYLGNTSRLVITPLTDKCYMTLMGALNMNLGGAPAGPAGTGKTESTKDLAKALAKQCVVFNCQESMDHTFVSKFFKGLASTGAWCCFDEFNRINLEVLSVIAQQLQELFTAKARRAPTLDFYGSFLTLKNSFCVFITMNPGYAGRTKLPDNLSALFRPVAMMVPDYSMIAEIKLFSFGFSKEKGRELAKKLVATFRLSSEQLSSQEHYDYGMRAVISVINAAGLLKKNNTRGLAEDQLIYKALTDVNLPKFLKDDIPLFEYIIKDLMPDTKAPEVDYGPLTPTIDEVGRQQNVQITEVFKKKVYQLYDTLQVRHGLMMVGPTGGGKSTNVKVLSQSFNQIAVSHPEFGLAPVTINYLNPKAITMKQLYGFNKDLNWQQGLVEVLFEHAAYNQFNPDPVRAKDLYWIMFDGPVDALWIESMNTVLDDNKKLCLSSGKVVKVSNFIKIMFEVEDLLVASPATVSRCGMVYMEPEALGLDPLFESFYSSIPPNLQALKGAKIVTRLRKVVDTLFVGMLAIIRGQCTEILSSMDNNLVTSFVKMINCWLDAYKRTQDQSPVKPDILERVNVGLENLALFSLVWSVGCTVDTEGRRLLDAYVKSKLPELDNVSIPLDQEEHPGALVYDYCFHFEKGEWYHWTEESKNYSIGQKETYSSIVVPTIDFVRYSKIQTILLSAKRHILCPGPTGTGKSITAMKLLSSSLGDPAKFMGLSVVLSAQTLVNQLQETVQQRLDPRGRGKIGPANGKKLICLIDDLNMPKKEEYFAQPPIELLRQYMDYKEWYDVENSKEIRKPVAIEDLVLMGAMGPPGGGRTFITNRIIRHFNIVTYTEIEDSVISSIFERILNHFFGKFDERVKGLIPAVIETVLQVYARVKLDLKPIPSKSHYTFNLRDISRVFQGLHKASIQHTQEPVHLARLWYHENLRVFHDRLTTEDDRQYLKEMLASFFGQFGVTAADVVPAAPAGEEAPRVIFCDFVKSAGGGGAQKRYVQVHEMRDLVEELENLQGQHDEQARSNEKLELVLFLDACEHVCRISRILAQPQGHALLLGVGGSGRQSLTRLAASIRGMDVKRIEVKKGYDIKGWREDLKNIIMDAIQVDKPMCFLFVDTQIIDEMMVEDINSLLNSGMVIGLPFKPEEEEARDKIGVQLCERARMPANQINKEQMQIERVRKNTHICFCMSPLGDKFFSRLRMFPAFINCCTIDWFTEWPEEALFRVGLKEVEEDAIDYKIEHLQEKLVQMFKFMHKSVERKTIDFERELRRHNYVTPTSYLELIDTYRNILKKKFDKNVADLARLQNGILQLKNAETEVKKLNEELSLKMPVLQKKEEEIKEYIKVSDQESKVAMAEEKLVNTKTEEADKEKAEAVKMQAKIREAFKQATIKLNESANDLQALEQKEISEFQRYGGSMSSGLHACGLGLYIVLMDLKDFKNEMRKLKTRHDQDIYFFKKSLQACFNKDLKPKLENIMKEKNGIIDAKRIKLIKSYIINHEERQQAWELSLVKKGSDTAVVFFNLINAFIKCFEINEENKPLQAELEATNAKVLALEESVQQKKAELTKIRERVKSLKDQIDQQRAEQKELNDEILQSQLKLSRAKKLTDLLKDEKERWGIEIENLIAQKALIPGNCVTSAGMVAYSGPFTSEYREEIEEEWLEEMARQGLEFTPGIRMKSFLEDKVQVQTWNLKELPKDDTSKENGIIMFESNRWPLMIDPQTQALRFIKNMGSSRGKDAFISIKASESKVMEKVEASIQAGLWILLENVSEQLDPALEPVLLRNWTEDRVKGKVIQLGEKSVMYNDHFKMFMTTTNPNPHFSPENCAKVTLINFGITPRGLEEQMLAIIVNLENRKLEIKKNQIVIKNAENKKQLKEQEDKILDSLVKNKNTLLAEDTIIDQLAESKNTSKRINQDVINSVKAEAECDRKREEYRVLAFQSSLLFFCIINLSNIEPMYQYSLQWFIKLFNDSAKRTSTGQEESAEQMSKEDFQLRLTALSSNFMVSLYKNVCRSLFGKDKLLFSFMMITRVLEGETIFEERQKSRPRSALQQQQQQQLEEEEKQAVVVKEDKTGEDQQQQQQSLLEEEDPILGEDEVKAQKERERKNKLDMAEYQYFLQGPQGDIEIPENSTEYIGEAAWTVIYKELFGLDKLATFKGILADFLKSPGDWENLYNSDRPQLERFPGKWEKRVTEFGRILLIKVFRSDKVKSAIRIYIERVKGVQYVEIPVVKLSDCFKDSSPTTPLVFILSEGSDPKGDFDAFASSEEVTKIESISLGKGQGKRAGDMIKRFITEGGWVLLQNCHLSSSWMPVLENYVATIPKNVNDNFRLWLTSMPSLTFPISILQNSVKMTIEPPQGLKDNIKKSYEAMGDEEMECAMKPQEYKKMLFGLCFFHAVIIERRKFGAIGWNIPYEFTYEDLVVCKKQLHIFLEMPDEIDFEVIQKICADINYGGRVTDKIDKRLINTIIKQYVCPQVVGEEYELSQSGLYKIPKDSSQVQYLEYINSLPAETPTEVFGLHPNAAITNDQDATRSLIETLISIQPKSSSGGGLSREELISETAKFVMERMPPVFNVEEVKKTYPPDAYLESMNTVLVQELIRYNKLLSLMDVRLQDVLKALKGEVVMSEELEKIADSMFKGQVPIEWHYPMGFLSLKPLNSWIQELNDRISFFEKWIKEGTPSAFWFSGFFFPQAFITGTLQNYARMHKKPIDTLDFRFEPKPQIDGPSCVDKPESGVYVYGMFLEGARWDTRNGHLIGSKPKELFSDLPLIHLVPEEEDVEEEEEQVVEKTSQKVTYQCPLYKVVSRCGTLSTTGHSTNFVMNIKLSSQQESEHWIKAGVAAFLSLRY